MKKDLLPKLNLKSAKRLGRGPGTGKGKTSGRGTKGQNARGRLSLTHSHFEGGQRPLIKRIPYRRGKGNSKVSKKPIVINLEALNIIPKGQIIDIESLIKHNIVKKEDAQIYGVKILGNGKVTNPLTVSVPTSKSAAKSIKKSGGNVISAK